MNYRLGNVYINLIESFQNSQNINILTTSSEITLAQQAKSMFLKECEVNPTAKTWLAVGLSCILLDDKIGAEDSFSVYIYLKSKEANILNNKDSQVWAYLALLSIKNNKLFEANQYISQALRLGIKDSDILKYFL